MFVVKFTSTDQQVRIDIILYFVNCIFIKSELIDIILYFVNCI